MRNRNRSLRGIRPRRRVGGLQDAQRQAIGPRQGEAGCSHSPRECEDCRLLVDALKVVLKAAAEAQKAIQAEIEEAEDGDMRLLALGDAQATIDEALAGVVAGVRSGQVDDENLSILSAVAMAWELAFDAGVGAGIHEAEVDAKHAQADRAMQAIDDDAEDNEQDNEPRRPGDL